ncbi:gamma-aminobutyric acid type B receptor subunit 2-like [Amphiura filiformis]|uniref:gamma-aminobutyric acid type B receptor subunit 2-like n=1 Tax=Amphiura filiformis TaxID=82378 RepID=UPI003B22293A
MAWITWSGLRTIIWLAVSIRTYAISTQSVSVATTDNVISSTQSFTEATAEHLTTFTTSFSDTTSGDFLVSREPLTTPSGFKDTTGVSKDTYTTASSDTTSSDFLISQEPHTTSSGYNDSNRGGKIPLYLGGLFSLSDPLWDASGVLPAVKMGLEHINNRTDILAEYELKMVWNNTQCYSNIGNRMFIDQVFKKPTKVVQIGPACSTSAEVIAGSAQFWNLITMSYSAEAPKLSDKNSYPYFYRTCSIGTSSNPAIIGLMRQFGWTRLATLVHGDVTFALAVEELISRVIDSNFTIVTSETVASNPEIQVANIKKKDGKIIYVYMYVDVARKIFCEAYRQEICTPEYVWIVPGWYSQQWWIDENDQINCTVNEMNEAVSSTTILTTEQLNIGTKDRATISGFTPKELESKLRDRLKRPLNENYTWNDYAPYGYDATWATGLMLNKSAQELVGKVFADGKKRRLEDFSYEDSEMLEIFIDILNQTDFEGMSGRITFRDGDRLADTSIGQIQEYKKIPVATYSINNDSLVWENNITWKGGYIPLDHTAIVSLEEYHGVSYASYVVMCLFAAIGILMAGTFLAFNIRYREERLVKRSSPNINNIIIIGSILIYTTVPIGGLDHQTDVSTDTLQAACQLRVWFLSTGFVLAFGSMFSKTWRVYRVAALKTPVRRVITDRYLFIMIFVFLCIDVFFLTLWQAIEPMHLETKEFDIEEAELTNQRVVTIHYIQQCTSDNVIFWLLPLYAYKGILLIFGTFLVWETRKVAIPVLNDSKLVGICVYNTVVLCIVGVFGSFLISDSASGLFNFTSCIIIFCATFTLLVLFIPKVRLLLQHPDGLPSTSNMATGITSTGNVEDSPAAAENNNGHGKNSPADVNGKDVVDNDTKV